MRILVMLASGLLVAGCGGSSDEDTVGKEIADDYKETMDKAREVEQELAEHMDDMDKAIEEAMDDVDEALEEVEDAIEDAVD